MWKNNSKSNSTRNLLGGNLLRIFGSVSVTTSWAISMYALYVYLGAALYSENRFLSPEIAAAIIFYYSMCKARSASNGEKYYR